MRPDHDAIIREAYRQRDEFIQQGMRSLAMAIRNLFRRRRQGSLA